MDRLEMIWEILVPAFDNDGNEFGIEHHKTWDSYVLAITGGLTVMKSAKGEWISPVGKKYKDKMIPCRIMCTKDQIKTIGKFTMNHYDQEAVLCYKISSEVIMISKIDKK